MIVHIAEANVQLTEMFVIIFIVYNKKNYFNVYSQRVGKIVYEIERDESDDRFYQSDYEFFIEAITITNSLHINQIKNENSDRSITLPSNGAPV